MINTKYADERYRHDSFFKNVVDTMSAILHNSEYEFTPLDLKDACYVARLKFEMENPFPRTCCISPSLLEDLNREQERLKNIDTDLKYPR